MTPLHCAAQRGLDKLVELLILRGANVDAVTYATCATPLYLAVLAGLFSFWVCFCELVLIVCVCKGYLNCATVLLKHGANPNAQDRQGAPPLQFSESPEMTKVHALLTELVLIRNCSCWWRMGHKSTCPIARVIRLCTHLR